MSYSFVKSSATQVNTHHRAALTGECTLYRIIVFYIAILFNSSQILNESTSDIRCF